MRSLVLFFSIFLLYSLNIQAEPRLAVFNWHENTNLNNMGKDSELLIQARTSGLSSDQVMNSFTISFSKTRNIKINKVIADNLRADYSFDNNILNIKFAQPKKNNGDISLYISYFEGYDKINKYLRQESIDIPAFAVGANAKITINFPWYLESATLNPNLTKIGNSFIYRNTVPSEGVQEIIKLTASKAVWDVNIKVKILSPQPLNKLDVAIPTFFQNAGQKVENTILTTNIMPLDQKDYKGTKTLHFETDEKELLINDQARISTGKENHTDINRNPQDYLGVNKNEWALLAPILEKIKLEPQYKNLPIYARIGKFVHEFIKYDKSYTGKLPPLEEILQNQTGVCTEYSKLFNSLARLAGIPSIIINGAACGEYDKCQGHSWNMIYYNNEWIDVDSTWDLMSGTVSSSHVYFSDEGKGDVTARYFDKNQNVLFKMDFEIKSL